ncbi:MAG TPA: DUF6457 domain-containing protein [Actinomycetota bacterium]|jgi:hypothetical protein|nr:DUF6457 domain-containing protein [Actinomycetota bacterium]
MFDEWVDELCVALGIRDDFDVDAVLELARDSAHEIERRAAPVTTFLVGLAAGRAGGGDAVSDTLATVLSLLRQRASG